MRKNRYLERYELQEIAAKTDWRRLFELLNLQKDEHKSKPDDWWAKSPLKPDERIASFHINARGWYCHSTPKGGGPIELVQAVVGARDGVCDCYSAAWWLVDNGVSSFVRAGERVATWPPQRTAAVQHSKKEAAQKEIQKEIQKENTPTKFDLRRYLVQQGTHPEFRRRGITAKTCRELGCGYLPDNREGYLAGFVVFPVFRVVSNNQMLKPLQITHIG